MCKFIVLQQVRRSLGLALHRGWAKLMPGRCRDLVQHPNQPRPMATEATDEDDEEARLLPPSPPRRREPAFSFSAESLNNPRRRERESHGASGIAARESLH